MGNEGIKMLKFKNIMQKKDILFFIVGIITSVFLTFVDLFTKQIIIDNVRFNSEIVVIKNFFSISHIRNSGAAWGIFSSETDILSIVTIICSLLIVYFIYASTVNKPMMFCLSAILAGACGNLIERLRLGYVTDFLAFDIFGYKFPNFNFADICITVGCFAMLFYVVFIQKKDKPLFRVGTLAYRFLGD